VIEREEIAFRAESPEALRAETEEVHPSRRWARRELPEARWERMRRVSIAVLRDGNEDPATFATTSAHLLVCATR
jgi:hypothetical protein